MNTSRAIVLALFTCIVSATVSCSPKSDTQETRERAATDNKAQKGSSPDPRGGTYRESPKREW